MSEEQGQSEVSGQPQPTSEKAGRSKAKAKEAREQVLASHRSQSIWPFALALAVIVLLVGFIVHPIVLGIGVVLVAAAIIGWGLERR